MAEGHASCPPPCGLLLYLRKTLVHPDPYGRTGVARAMMAAQSKPRGRLPKVSPLA